MPTYEFVCTACNRVRSEFLSMRPITQEAPRDCDGAGGCGEIASMHPVIGAGTIATARIKRMNNSTVVSRSLPLWAGKDRGFKHDAMGHVVIENNKQRREIMAGALNDDPYDEF